MTVDAIGNRKDPKEQILRRTADAYLDDYMRYNIDLGFTPSSDRQECNKECADAFAQIARDCNSTDGERLSQYQISLIEEENALTKN